MGPSIEPWGTPKVAGGVTRRCVAGTNTLGSACEVGFSEVEDRSGDSKTGMKSG